MFKNLIKKGQDYVYDDLKNQGKNILNEKVQDIKKNIGQDVINQGEEFVLQGATFGLLSKENNELKIQNPVLKAIRIINNNIRGAGKIKQGIWIGTRALGILGVDLEILMINHWSCMVDGHNFSLTTDSGSIDGKITIQEVDEYNYNWNYYGERHQPIELVRQFVQYINNQQLPYDLIGDNCQRFSIRIAEFASIKQIEPKLFQRNIITVDQQLQNIIIAPEAVTRQSNNSKVFDDWFGFLYNDRYDRLKFMNQKGYQSFQQFLEQQQKKVDYALNFEKQKQIKQSMEDKGFFLNKPTKEQILNYQNKIQQQNINNLQQNQLKNQNSMLNNTQKYQTIGQLNNKIKTIGQLSSNVRNNNYNKYSNSMNYDNAFLLRSDRMQQSSNVYGPSLYGNSPNFILNSNSNQNNGFINRSFYNPIQPTVRKSIFTTQKEYSDNPYSSFQQINYNLPKQVQKAKLPFQNKYQVDNYQVNKKVKLEIPKLQYNNNAYTNQQSSVVDEEEEYDEEEQPKYITE